jgi:hypothetical protein
MKVSTSKLDILPWTRQLQSRPGRPAVSLLISQMHCRLLGGHLIELAHLRFFSSKSHFAAPLHVWCKLEHVGKHASTGLSTPPHRSFVGKHLRVPHPEPHGTIFWGWRSMLPRRPLSVALLAPPPTLEGMSRERVGTRAVRAGGGV